MIYCLLSKHSPIMGYTVGEMILFWPTPPPVHICSHKIGTFCVASQAHKKLFGGDVTLCIKKSICTLEAAVPKPNTNQYRNLCIKTQCLPMFGLVTEKLAKSVKYRSVPRTTPNASMVCIAAMGLHNTFPQLKMNLDSNYYRQHAHVKHVPERPMRFGDPRDTTS